MHEHPGGEGPFEGNTMRAKRIILDLDDVLNMLSLDLLRFDGLDYRCYDDIGEWKWGYDIIGATQELRQDNKRMGLVEYWERIPRELWSETRLSWDFHNIIEFCETSVGRDNVLVATSPTKCPECLAGKYEWMIKYLPKWLHRQWSITPRKWEYGRDPHSLLIDDLEENCMKFSQWGAKAILVPRPWNSCAGEDVMDAILAQWEDIHEEVQTVYSDHR